MFANNWKLNDTWDPYTASNTPSLKSVYHYDDHSSVDADKPTWETWGCQNSEDTSWQNKITFLSPQRFLDDLLPVAPAPAAHIKRLQDAKHFSGLTLSNQYYKYCDALNAALRIAKSSHVVKDIEPNPEPRKIYHRYPALALYPTTKVAREAYTLPPDTDLSHIQMDRRAQRARASWAHMLVAIEVCYGYSFDEPEERARMYHYAARVFNHQHRQHIFSLHFSTPYSSQPATARIVFWDRAGAVASHPIPLDSASHFLYEFIHRLARLTPEQQGFDGTAQLAPKFDTAKLLRYEPTNHYLKRYHKDMISNSKEWPLYKVYCDPVFHDEMQDQRVLRPRPRAFLIGKPLNHREREEESPFGKKSVRAYIAYDLAHDRLVFLKDFWREDDDDEYAETAVYVRLQRHNIQYVATAIAGGDVSEFKADADIQSTVTDAYKKPSPMYHHRVVLKEICRPLWTYTCTSELIIAVYHAILAHRDCWTRAGVLHRDISHNNIMIDVSSEEPRGVLIDFDNCLLNEHLGEDKWAHGLCGTTPFHSQATLDSRTSRPKSVADDSESFIYVLVWMALRYQPHERSISCNPSVARTPEDQAAINATNVDLGSYINNLFGCKYSGYMSAHIKKGFIMQGRPPVKLLPSSDGKPTTLAILLRKLYLHLQEHALAVEYQEKLEMEAKYREYRARERKREAKIKAEEEKKQRMRTTRSMAQKAEEKERLERRYTYHFHRRQPLVRSPSEELRLLEEAAREKRAEVAKEAALFSRMKKSKPVMDDHFAIIETFRSVIFDDEGQVKLKRLEVSDKYTDQWLDLPARWGDWWRPHTERVEKRKAEEESSGSEDAGRPTKRKRL